MQQTDAGVIIAGAGPAGAIAAYILASSGISVLLFEKSGFPRYKVCGGGLTHRVLAEIPFDLTPVIERSIYSVRFSCDFKEVFTRTAKDPIMYCTMRERLDIFLVEAAMGKGAKVHFEEQVTRVDLEGGLVKVETSRGTYYSRMVIGAEGASGTVSRVLGLRDHIMPGLAWEAELKPPPEFLQSLHNTIFLDWGTLPGGYGWIFPKQDHISAGVGGPASVSKAMMPYYDQFLESAGLTTIRPTGVIDRELAFAETISLRSWPIPSRVKKAVFHKGNILITGDAAGLIDPLTGEGIYYAIRSGKLAAKSCMDYLSGKKGAIAGYSEAVNDEIMQELVEAHRIKSLFNTIPLTIHNLLKKSDHAWSGFGKILRGDRHYADVRRGFGMWKFVWRIACWISGIFSFLRERRYIRKRCATPPAGQPGARRH